MSRFHNDHVWAQILLFLFKSVPLIHYIQQTTFLSEINLKKKNPPKYNYSNIFNSIQILVVTLDQVFYTLSKKSHIIKTKINEYI